MALGLVNADWIRRGEAVPLGASSLKHLLDEERLATATERVSAALDEFRTRAGAAGFTNFEARAAQGAPLDVVAAAVGAHDLLVVGRGARFDMEEEDADVAPWIDTFVRRSIRPALLVPSGAVADPATGPALIAFDDSAAASRALHMFALLGLGADRDVHVVSVDRKSRAHALEIAERGCALLRMHGATRLHPVGLDETEADGVAATLLALARALEAGVLAIGAYGHSGVREIFGSCTRTILRGAGCAVFVHH